MACGGSLFLCPVVARQRWTVIGVAVFLGLFIMLLEKLLTGLFSSDNLQEGLSRSLTRWDSWLAFVGVAVLVWVLVNVANLTLLYRRSRELRASFREAYPQGEG